MRSLRGSWWAGLIAVITAPLLAAVAAAAPGGSAAVDAGAAPSSAPLADDAGAAPDGAPAQAEGGATGADAGAPGDAAPREDGTDAGTATIDAGVAPPAASAVAPPVAPPPRAVAKPSAPPAAPPRHPPGAPPPAHDGWLGFGFFGGFIDENERTLHVFDLPGGARPPDPWLSRGGWVGVEGQYLFAPWIALAARLRAGYIDRGPGTTPEHPLASGSDASTLDPQLGDSKAGGSVGAFVRLFTGNVVLDVGGTWSIASFRPRLAGDKLDYASATCSSCYSGQDGIRGMDFWPTLRVSSTGPGFFYAVDTGESFVQTDQPGLFEALVGRRGQDWDVMGGFGRGLALRIDGRLSGAWWLDVNASYKPWDGSVRAHGAERMIGAIGITRRFSGLSPL